MIATELLKQLDEATDWKKKLGLSPMSKDQKEKEQDTLTVLEPSVKLISKDLSPAEATSLLTDLSTKDYEFIAFDGGSTEQPVNIAKAIRLAKNGEDTVYIYSGKNKGLGALFISSKGKVQVVLSPLVLKDLNKVSKKQLTEKDVDWKPLEKQLKKLHSRLSIDSVVFVGKGRTRKVELQSNNLVNGTGISSKIMKWVGVKSVKGDFSVIGKDFHGKDYLSVLLRWNSTMLPKGENESNNILLGSYDIESKNWSFKEFK